MTDADEERNEWMASMRRRLEARFCDEFDDRDRHDAAFERHNDGGPRRDSERRLLEWSAGTAGSPFATAWAAGPERAFPQGQHDRGVPGDGGDALPGAIVRSPSVGRRRRVDFSQNTLYRLL